MAKVSNMATGVWAKKICNVKDQVKKSKWHGTISPFFKQVENYREKFKSNLVVTIFEWQYFTPTLFGYGNGIVNYIMAKADELLQSNVNYLSVGYLATNQIAIIAKCADSKKYQKQVKKFFQKCLEFGALIEPIPIYISFKAGSAMLTDCTITTLDNAYLALFEAKASNTTYHQFLSNSNVEIVQEGYHKMQLAAYFLEAIHNHRLRLAFQPIIEARTGKVESYEALLRILTREGQIISAGPFIPAAEHFGFINLIDNFVLQVVAEELRFDKDVRIAMNISNLTVKDNKWYNKAKSLLTSNTATRLTIEITETGNENSIEKVAQFVDKVKSLGCNVAIDDFGAGYTSFKQLKLISADILKIDGVFIKDIIDNHESKLFVNILLEFARAYNLKTVAEFVETGEIAKVLMELGVDYLQGFYFDEALNYRPWIRDKAIT